MEIGISTTLHDCGKHNFNRQKRFDLFNLPSDAVCNYPALLFGVDCGICRVTRSTAMVLTECRYFFCFLGGGGFVLKPPF